MKVRLQVIIDESKLDFIEDCPEIDDMTEEERSEWLEDYADSWGDEIILDVVASVVSDEV